MSTLLVGITSMGSAATEYLPNKNVCEKPIHGAQHDTIGFRNSVQCRYSMPLIATTLNGTASQTGTTFGVVRFDALGLKG